MLAGVQKCIVVCVMLICAGSCRPQIEPLQIQKSDTIVFLGNTFAERMSLFGFFETLLHASYPEHQLKVRNMGWSGDEVGLMPRPQGFPKLEDELASLKPDHIFAFFGMNESFLGKEGEEQFKRDLGSFIQSLQRINTAEGVSPQVVLVSPIAQEIRNNPVSIRINDQLEQYTAIMSDIAGENGIRFLDLFAPTRKSYRDEEVWTINGIHPNEYGDWKIAGFMANALGLPNSRSATNASGNPSPDTFRRIVYEKNFQFFLRWRGPNAEYIHGERNNLPGAHELPEEMAEIDQLLEAYDEEIWSMDKPSPAHVLSQAPAGAPIWYPTPGDPVPEDDSVYPETEPYGRTPVLSPEESLTKFKLPPGYQINLFASEKDFPIANPMALNFDGKGRLWVANTPTWPQPIPGLQPDDSIVILEDTDWDGVADHHTVFIDKLMMIHGFALADGGAFISQAPNIIYAGDSDNDLRADELEVVLHGFGTEDIEHAINNYKWGPDGAMYFTEGIFFHSQVETPYGPVRLNDGGQFRYKPDIHRLDVEASYKFWNPWGQTFDEWGQNIILDASSTDFYNASVLSSNYKYPQDKGRKSGKDPLSFSPQLGPSGGLELFHSRHFPEEVQGRLMTNQFVGFNGTRWFNIREKGSTYEVDMIAPDFISSSDPYYRPIAMTVGPDGALYIVDFYSPTFENTVYPKRLASRDHSRGRIWRVTHESGELLEPLELDLLENERVLGLLAETDFTVRNNARREIQQRPPEAVLPSLEAWLAALDTEDEAYEQLLLEGLWIYQEMNHVAVDLLHRLINAKDYHIRAAATRVLRYWIDEIQDAPALLARLVEDNHIRVRLEAVIALGHADFPEAEALVLKAATLPTDMGLDHAIQETLKVFRE
ncbi:unnamed protein product [Laminaria digitata]